MQILYGAFRYITFYMYVFAKVFCTEFKGLPERRRWPDADCAPATHVNGSCRAGAQAGCPGPAA
jgi:hypothetical protein